MSFGVLGLSLLAGILSTLSPCVLPLLPIVIGTAASQHRWGPLALAGGLALSFVMVGMFVATIGFAVGLDTGVFRSVAAILMVGVGAVLLAPSLQQRVAVAAGPVGAWAESRLDTVGGAGLQGQFLIGLLLGALWSPCVGPTLGAASLLAAQRQNLGEVALTMLAFGIGAAVPLLLIGLMSRETILRVRGRMMAAGGGAKTLLGGMLVIVGLLVLSGADKAVEARLVAASPQWLTDLTTRY
jgi:cytochrome c biogenesis protein CcdA